MHKTEHVEEAVREEKVTHARQLVQDPSYPSPKVMRAVAHLLARKWYP